jgi:hypothetical protein
VKNEKRYGDTIGIFNDFSSLGVDLGKKSKVFAFQNSYRKNWSQSVSPLFDLLLIILSIDYKLLILLYIIVILNRYRHNPCQVKRHTQNSILVKHNQQKD